MVAKGSAFDHPGPANQVRELGALSGEPDMATLLELGARYGVKADFEGTGPILQRHGLRL